VSSAPASDASTLTLMLPCDTASHSLALVPLVSARATSPRGPAEAAEAACSARSRARRSSHRALSVSARVRPSALCRRHSVTCASYEAFQASCSAAETGGDKVGRSGCCCCCCCCSAPAPAPAGAAADSEGGVRGEGETRVRLGGVEEKGSERAACVGRSVRSTVN
jgi:hypothetical protein